MKCKYPLFSFMKISFSITNTVDFSSNRVYNEGSIIIGLYSGKVEPDGVGIIECLRGQERGKAGDYVGGIFEKGHEPPQLFKGLRGIDVNHGPKYGYAVEGCRGSGNKASAGSDLAAWA